MNTVRVYHKPAANWEIVDQYETEENLDELLERFSLLAPRHAAKLRHNRVELFENANSSVVVLVVTINLTSIE